MKRLSLTAWSLIALGLGLGLGLIGHKIGAPVFFYLGEAAKAVGGLWVAALQLTVLPLVISNLLAAITGARAKAVGMLGVRAFLLFLVMLAASGVFAAILTRPLVSFVAVDQTAVTSLRAAAPSTGGSGPTTPGATTVPNSTGGSTADWIATLLPTNLFEAALKGDLLPLLLFTAFFAIAVTRLSPERHQLLSNVFHGLSEAMLQLTQWLLVVTPVGVFALTFLLAFKTGGAVGGMLGGYIFIASLLMVLFTLLLYPVTAIIGRTKVSTFARAVAPAQMVAASTRSSIAALPALVKGGNDLLRLPETGTGFLLPLSVALFKVNRPMSSMVKLMLVAHVYSVPLRPTTILIFLASVIIISFGTAGIPQSGPGLKTLPAYIAAGIPIEGVIVIEAVEAIPDIFKTVLNVTGDMSVTTLLTRAARSSTKQSIAVTDAPAPAEGVL